MSSWEEGSWRALQEDKPSQSGFRSRERPVVPHGTGESPVCLRDWPQARNTECLGKQYTDEQHAVVPCSFLPAKFCCFKDKFLCFQQNLPWPYKTLKSYVAQRNHENFAEVCSQLLTSQLVVQSLLPGTSGTGVSKGEALPCGLYHRQLLVRAACPSKRPPKPSQHCSAVARTIQTSVPSCC